MTQKPGGVASCMLLDAYYNIFVKIRAKILVLVEYLKSPPHDPSLYRTSKCGVAIIETFPDKLNVEGALVLCQKTIVCCKLVILK